MSNYEILSLLVQISSSALIAFSILLLAKQLKLFSLAHSDNHDWNRRIATQQELAKIEDVDLDRLNEAFDIFNQKEPVLLEDIRNAFNSKPSLQISLHKLLNIYERLANGVFLGTYDEVTIKANRRKSMERLLTSFRYYINYRRDGFSNTAWVSFERLVNKWNIEALECFDRGKTGIL